AKGGRGGSGRTPTTRPVRLPASGPGSGSTTGGAAVGSRTVIRATAHLLSVRPIVRESSDAHVRERVESGSVRAEVVADGIVFGEGPVWVPEGTPGGPSLVVTSVAAGALYRIPPGGARADVLADTGGRRHRRPAAARGRRPG